MSFLASVARGPRSRAGTSALIVVVAMVAVAAATLGPTYYVASQTSILRDSVAEATVVGRGFDATASGPVAGGLSALEQQVTAAMAATQPSAAKLAHLQGLFSPEIDTVLTTAYYSAESETIPLVWRSDMCAHLRITGNCPVGSNQVLVSRSLAATNRWQVGQHLPFPGVGTVTVSGLYGAPGMGDDYWFQQYGTFFPYEYPPGPGGRSAAAGYDAMFTDPATLAALPSGTQGSAIVDEVLSAAKLLPRDVANLRAAMTDLVNSASLSSSQVVVVSEIPATMATVKAAWSALAVPVFLVTLEVLVLAWLMLSLLVTEAVATRGPEVALAKLRGFPRWRTVMFGLSEPTTLLLVALPLGAVTGWGAANVLGGALLRAGTPVRLTALGGAAAVAGTAGGFVALVVASQRTLRRPVIELWGRAGRRANDRNWVLDAVLLTGAVFGLAQLWLSGEVSSTRHSAISLLVPGLLGVAVAVVASRLLPLACRAAAGTGNRSDKHAGRRPGGLAWYLALRHVARRRGGARTTIMLATSFALATFAVSAWAVDQANYRTVAVAQVGAPAVLTVSTPGGQDLGHVVATADPTGHLAAAVEQYTSNNIVTLAVDPQRWAQVTTWSSSKANASALAAELDPPAPPPLILTGDAVQVKLAVSMLTPSNSDLTLDVVESDGAGVTPVDLGELPANGAVTATAELVNCPCTVTDFTLVPFPTLSFGNFFLQGSVTLSALSEQQGGTWHRVDAGFTSTARWLEPPPLGPNAGPLGSLINGPPGSLTAGPKGLAWNFNVPSDTDAVLTSVNRPTPLPAIAAARLTDSRTGPLAAYGLDGENLPVNVVATLPAVPGAPANGVVVDRSDAELAANDNVSNAVQQVWLAAGAYARVEPRLVAAGLDIVSVEQQSSTRAALDRQGPGLAAVLFLAEGAAAAALAAGGAILGLYLSARRRRYEYAALSATGLTNRTLLAALAAEQLVVLAYGCLVGIATGIAAAALAIRDVPEFVTAPSAPALSHLPPPGEVAAILAAAVLVILALAGATSVVLIRGVRLDQLREAPA